MGATKREEGKNKGDGEKIEWKLSEVNTRAEYRGENEWIGEFKMTVDDVINIIYIFQIIA